MKFGSNLQFECPDQCPSDCIYKDGIRDYGQNAICTRCPVLICKGPKTEEDKKYMPLVPADQYRDDWAKEWVKFFKTNEEPLLEF